ncbi:MAG: cobalamin biosynthesis bifunctional protein CbiET, partial [Pseudomonadota bacterium]
AISVAIEHKAERVEMIRQNMVNLGAEKMVVVEGRAPGVLEDLPQPDAIFIGGGLTCEGLFDAAWAALRPGGRLVANVVTLESEGRLFELHQKFGGELVRLSVQKAESVGPYRGWRAAMPVTQWSVTKPGEAA